MNAEDAIRGLAEEARRIGHQHADQVSSWDRMVKAKGELLAAIVDAIRPALAAISSRIEIRSRAGSTEPANFRGLCVAGGLREGRAIYLTEYGALVEMLYSLGTTPSSWEGTWAPMTPAELVAQGEEIEPVIESIARALVQQSRGSGPARIEALTKTAQRFEAVALLLRGLR